MLLSAMLLDLARLCRPAPLAPPPTRGKPRLLDVGRRILARDGFAPDSPLEGDGFEISVPRYRRWSPGSPRYADPGRAAGRIRVRFDALQGRELGFDFRLSGNTYMGIGLAASEKVRIVIMKTLRRPILSPSQQRNTQPAPTPRPRRAGSAPTDHRSGSNRVRKTPEQN